MNCLKAEKWLSQKLDGELSLSRVEQLGRHLETCERCRSLDRVWSGIAIEPAETAPSAEQMWQDVQRDIRIAPSGRNKSAFLAGWQPAWSFAAVAVLMVAVLAGLLFNPFQNSSNLATAFPGNNVEFLETGLPGASSVVYVDEDTGWTVIWVVEADTEENNNGAG